MGRDRQRCTALEQHNHLRADFPPGLGLLNKGAAPRKIEKNGRLIRGQDDVPRLHISMHQPFLMDGMERTAKIPKAS